MCASGGARSALRALVCAASILVTRCLAAQTDQSPNLPDAPTPQGQVKTAPHPKQAEEPEESDVTFLGTPKRILLDEKGLMTSPVRLKAADARWLLPLAATTGILIGSDAHTISLMHINANDQRRASDVTNGAVGFLGALPAGMFLWSSVRSAPLARETSLLTGESLADAMILDEAGKAIFRRNRPLISDRQGNFFRSSFSGASFPSGHATAAWAMAAVIGDEYPGWLTRTVVYTLAATTSAGSVVAEKHFPSDVLVGSALGWLVGHYVYRAHHRYDLTPYEEPPGTQDYVAATTSSSAEGMRNLATESPSPNTQPTTTPQPKANPTPQTDAPYDVGDLDPDTVGSTNVPMDNWVYPALERLGAMGFIPSQSIAIRPWTRIECARQVAEASDMIAGYDPADGTFTQSAVREAERLLDALKHEFEGGTAAKESLTLDSVYTRYGNIAGPALTDSYHFGQTWWNDFGRPLGRGGSTLFGLSFRAREGRLFLYARNEIQQGPGTPADSAGVQQLIAKMDSNPVQLSEPLPSYTRDRPIEVYAGLAFEGNALSFGKQELFWGPTTMGPLAFSSNAEPTYNLRFVSTRPHPLPFFPNLGTYRFDIVMGKMSGHMWPARPWYNGQKADFNFGQNLELSFTRFSLLWGVGHPMTLGSLLGNLKSVSSSDTCPYGQNCDVGARSSDFDFRLRVPWTRKVVTLYADAYVHDDVNPIDAPRRAVWNPGIYFARLPLLPHMDLRVEAVSSEGLFKDFGPNQFFWTNQYHDMDTNKGFMIGNAAGRDNRAEEGRVGWWWTAQTRVEAGFRQNKYGTVTYPGGGTVSDGFVNATVQIGHQWEVKGFGQYERFLIPSLMTGSQINRSGWVQIVWTPEFESK